jgi:hypothetical protein
MIFVGNFLVLTSQEQIAEKDRRHGEFNLIIETATKEVAIDLFQQKIKVLRDSTRFFEGDCSIFLIQLLEFDGMPKNLPLMLTYKSTAGDPMMPYISCLVPTELSDACRIFNWDNNRPEIDGNPEHIFLSFKEQESLKVKAKRLTT